MVAIVNTILIFSIPDLVPKPNEVVVNIVALRQCLLLRVILHIATIMSSDSNGV